MPVWPSRGFWSSLNFRGFLWIAVGTVFILSFLLYSSESTTAGAQAGPMDWLFRSWPALFAAAGAMWLLLAGPAVRLPAGHAVRDCSRRSGDHGGPGNSAHEWHRRRSFLDPLLL